MSKSSKKRSFYPKVYSHLEWFEGVSEYQTVYTIYTSKWKFFETRLSMLRAFYPDVMSAADEIAEAEGDDFCWEQMLTLLFSEGFIPTSSPT